MNKKNWDDIRFVLTVARTGSLNTAAARLGVTHATVMRRVAAFEAGFGQEMFLKSASGYKPRSDAAPILRSMESIEEALMAMERTIAGADQSLSGSVRIASTDSLCSRVLPPIIARAAKLHPRITLSLFSANSHHDLTRLSTDIVVRATNKLDDTLTGQNVGRLKFAVYDNGQPRKNWLRLEGVLTGSEPAKWMAEHVPPEQQTGGADSFLALQHLVAQGIGKAVLPAFLGDADPGLRRSDGLHPNSSVKIWVAMLKDYAHVPRFVTIQQVLSNELRKSRLFAA
ncbi:MAG: LysR family transcriptional regulator [Paracoccaceae bacterium]|jgi:DNA-binding transcriptional LysR family regulator|nr:LysR family transcriptional regulator [Paracoccaceae bacterium]MDP7186569.1 LysR family transcriptional regulator [Paracoccaceae bacterium]